MNKDQENERMKPGPGVVARPVHAVSADSASMPTASAVDDVVSLSAGQPGSLSPSVRPSVLQSVGQSVSQFSGLCRAHANTRNMCVHVDTHVYMHIWPRPLPEPDL